MICAVIICAILAGGNGRCSPEAGAMQIVDLPHIERATDCHQVARDIREGALPLPVGLRFVRVEMIPKAPQTAEEPPK